jgi:hypothetical protein
MLSPEGTKHVKYLKLSVTALFLKLADGLSEPQDGHLPSVHEQQVMSDLDSNRQTACSSGGLPLVVT